MNPKHAAALVAAKLAQYRARAGVLGHPKGFFYGLAPRSLASRVAEARTEMAGLRARLSSR